MNVEALLEAARQEAGLRDFGDEGFIAPMTRFLALEELLTEQGRGERLEMARRWLVSRLRLQRDLTRHPEILDEDVSDPLVILGLPRSGSTALQRMVSADAGVQTLYTWQVMNPAPFPDETPGNPAPRIAYARRAEELARTQNPEGFAAHAVLAEDADEDTMLHWISFNSIHMFSLAPASQSYIDYLTGFPRQPSYQFVADLYRYLQWQDGGKRNRRWVMKSPNHVGCLEEMLAVHPKATFIYLKRDYHAIFASMCKLMEVHYQHTYRHIDPHTLGEVLIGFWANEMARHRQARERLGSRLRLLELNYSELLDDPLPGIRSAYELAGMELTPTGEKSIRNWLVQNPQGKHGKVDYDLDRYGISPDRIDAIFGTV